MDVRHDRLKSWAGPDHMALRGRVEEPLERILCRWVSVVFWKAGSGRGMVGGGVKWVRLCAQEPVGGSLPGRRGR